jgi:GNAT superfamily N-acetyltransferase
MDISLEDFDTHPKKVSRQIVLASGQEAFIRPLRSDDARILGNYFLSLSQETRSLFAPHPFDQETANKLCAEIDSMRDLRMVTLVEEKGQEQIVAYFITRFYIGESSAKRYKEWGILLNGQTDCEIAPSVADDYQKTGLGSLVMTHLTKLLQELGYKRMILIGGVQQRNTHAIRFYEKFGFRVAAEFTTRVSNYDMIADL